MCGVVLRIAHYSLTDINMAVSEFVAVVKHFNNERPNLKNVQMAVHEE